MTLFSKGAASYYSDIYPVRNSISITPTHHQLPRLCSNWAGLLGRAVWERCPELRVILRLYGILTDRERGSLQDELRLCVQDHMFGCEIRKCLDEICAHHELPSPEKRDVFPLSATSNLLYRVQSFVIKIFLHKASGFQYQKAYPFSRCPI